MSIKRAYSKDTYTVARIVNINDGATVRTDVEYKRGVGSVKPDNLTSMLTAGGETSLLVNNNLYTKQAFPLVADAIQGYDSDYFMWTDIDSTARWYQASGWRDWSRNGQDSYQQVLGTYDASFLNSALEREQDLTFCEIDDMSNVIGSTTRVLDLKMASIVLPELEAPSLIVPQNIERYVYNLNGTTDFLQYNSLDTTRPDTQLDFKKGNSLGFTYKATTVTGGTGETVMKSASNQYITYPAIDLIMRVPQLLYTDTYIELKFNTNTSGTIIAGTSQNGNFIVETTPEGKVKVTAPALYGSGTATSSASYLPDTLNNLIVFWDFIDRELVFTVNGNYTKVGDFDGALLTNSDITIQSLGSLDPTHGTFTPTGDFDGIIKDVVLGEGGSLGSILRNMPINELTGIVVVETEFDQDGLRVNMTDVDIDPVITGISYLISGIGVTGGDLYLDTDNKLNTNNATWIESIEYDGVAIDILTFVAPEDNDYHTIDIVCNEVCNIARLGVDELETLYYKGSMYDFKILKGKQETVWELKTYASLKQDPFTLTALSFGFDTTNYTNDNWSLITTGLK